MNVSPASSLGARPQTPKVGFAEFWAKKPVLCEAEQRFLLLFPEKEECRLETLI
jgi:hypothetical protein